MSTDGVSRLVAPARPAGWQARAWRWLVREGAPLMALADACLIAAVLLGCYEARFVWGWLPPAAPPPAWGPYAHAAGLVAGVWTACLAWVGLYDRARAPSRFDDAVLLGVGLGLGASATLALSFFYRSFSYSRLEAAYAFGASLLVLCTWHWLARTAQRRALAAGIGARPTLVLGDNALGQAVAARLVGPRAHGHRLVGVLALPGDAAAGAGPALRLGSEADLAPLIAAHGVEAIVIAWPEATPAALVERLSAIATRWPRLAVHVAPDVAVMRTMRLAVTSLDGLPVLAVREVPLRHWRHRAGKRTMDVVLAGLGLVLAAPLMGAIAALIAREGAGPVIYTQERLGRDGTPFRLHKFRTMPVDAEPGGPVWAHRGDTRATRLGAWLRRYSLDELPQLWNVLRGDMRLVGPRPERPYFADQFRARVPKYMDRHLVRCGLTGWAQVNGLRGDVSIEDRTHHDIWYVENWSVLLDIRILLLTAAEVVRRPAY